MEALFSVIQLVAIPVVVIAMFKVPWAKPFYLRFGEVGSVVLAAGILLVLHITALILADMTAPAGGLATFFSGIISFILFGVALIRAKIAKSRHLKQ